MGRDGAFRALLPGTLMLVKRHEGRRAALADARGGRAGTVALAGFALVIVTTAQTWSPWLAIPKMPRGSAIIATSSVNAFTPSESLPDYSATKGAINQLTKVLAQQLVHRDIRVNAVAPGPVWTPLNPADTGITREQLESFGAQTPLERPAQPEELAPAHVVLASAADSRYISGVVLPVLGGEPIGG